MTTIPTLTRFDAAVYLRVHINTIDKWVKRGLLPAYKRGTSVFFFENDLKALYQRKEVHGHHEEAKEATTC